MCVRRCGEEIVTRGFGKQRDFGIMEEVVKEAVVIKGLGIGEAVCRVIFAESGVRVGRQGGQ